MSMSAPSKDAARAAQPTAQRERARAGVCSMLVCALVGCAVGPELSPPGSSDGIALHQRHGS